MLTGLGAYAGAINSVGSSSLTDIAADLYGQAAYGNIPTLETMNATVNAATGELSTDFGTVAQAIQQAEDSGDYNPDSNLPVNASGNLSSDPTTWLVWIIGGVALYFVVREVL